MYTDDFFGKNKFMLELIVFFNNIDSEISAIFYGYFTLSE